METVTSSQQSFDVSSFSNDVFTGLSSRREEALSSWSGFIAGSVAGNPNLMFCDHIYMDKS